MDRTTFRGPGWRLWAPLLLYVAALNPYFLPDVYDDVTYFHAAQSLAERGAFEFQGEAVRRWPPLFPLMLAGLQRVGLRSPLYGKLWVLGCVALSAWLLHGLWQRERRPHALRICILFLCLPWSLFVGSGLLSEWPCIALSLGFLRLLPRLEAPRVAPGVAVGAGLLLGAAGLTRWIAVLLGAALLMQAARKLQQKRGLASLWPQALAGAVGALLVLGWFAGFVQSTRHIPGLDGDTWHAVVDVVQPTQQAANAWFYAMPSWRRAAELVANLLFFHSRPLERWHLDQHPLRLLAVVPVALILLGVVVRWRRRELLPSDAYALCTAAVFGFFATLQMRYWVPIAPFLLHYFFIGTRRVELWIAPRTRATTLRAWARVGVGGWLAYLLVLCLWLLVQGNGRTYNGLSVLRSPTPQAFYRGYWHDLYQVSQVVRRAPELAPVCVLGHPGAVRYVLAFSGQPAEYCPGDRPVGSLLQVHPAEVPESLRRRLGPRPEARVGTLTLHRVTP